MNEEIAFQLLVIEVLNDSGAIQLECDQEDQKERDERGRDFEGDQQEEDRGHYDELEHHQDADDFGWVGHLPELFAPRL